MDTDTRLYYMPSVTAAVILIRLYDCFQGHIHWNEQDVICKVCECVVVCVDCSNATHRAVRITFQQRAAAIKPDQAQTDEILILNMAENTLMVLLGSKSRLH